MQINAVHLGSNATPQPHPISQLYSHRRRDQARPLRPVFGPAAHISGNQCNGRNPLGPIQFRLASLLTSARPHVWRAAPKDLPPPLCVAGRPLDSSDESHSSSSLSQDDVPLARRVAAPPTTRESSTQTAGTMLEHVQWYAGHSSMAVVKLAPIRDQFWAHVLSCMKMPRGGVQGGGSMHSTFEFVAASETVVQYVMEDLSLMKNRRFNLTLPFPHWEPSPSISTYCALDQRTLDSFFRLHRRRAARGARAYRGSLLAHPPDGYNAAVCLLSATAPFLAELCHRKHGKLVLAVSFNMTVLNDQNHLTLSPSMNFVLGMDTILKERCLDHLKKMRASKQPMSIAFEQLADARVSTLPESEGEWVPPPSDLAQLWLPSVESVVIESCSDEQSDAEEQQSLRAASDVARHRAEGTRWAARMRQR